MAGGLSYPYSSARKDPLKGFNFRVEFVGKRNVAKAGFKNVTGLKVGTELIEIEEGGRSDYKHTAIKRVTYEPITLTRGMSMDKDIIKQFAEQFDVMQGGMHRATDDNLMLVKVILLDRDQKTVRKTWTYQGVIITEYRADDMDATSSEALLESITFQFQHVDSL